MTFRICTAATAGVLAGLGWVLFDWESPLNVSLAIMSAFIACQTAGSYLWARPYIGAAAPEPAPGAPAPANAYADAAKLAITTQGVVLGLVSFSGASSDSEGLSLTVKVGAASLAGGVLIATAMYLLVAQAPPPDPNRRFAASVLLSLLLWALAFGLVCVVTGNWS